MFLTVSGGLLFRAVGGTVLTVAGAAVAFGGHANDWALNAVAPGR